MGLAVRRRLGVADTVTLVNAVIGFAAAVVAYSDPALAARLILLAAIADALDGIVARFAGNTEVGPLLDSITDVVSFGATPALFVHGVAREAYGPLGEADTPLRIGLVVLASSFVVFSVVRTAFYTVYVDEGEQRPGIQNTLAATILAAAYLAGVAPVPVLLAGTVVLSALMIAPVGYPKLRARDALVLGLVQAGAIVDPGAFQRVFPRVLLVAAVAYLALAPRYYWGE
ncbi:MULTISPECIES: protein sorting system archaetidylserine synthase [Halomicrobium]|uniref:CDP-alcohol phosphatidyltransferase n=2 Tax=Halomicrobium mukohataei TaxID=57705 RepID=C7NY42_HALMD|nr:MULTISPECIES: protein sorting system archaetidylserine synthase [Halomicrobium]ACV48502.1 CDP-alcohol phosphatidyltransferase [Halomicrobium mukohataei DSM 12286]QCD66903.1 phosphatidylcholine/phosphatidylserine synthase [Halomicrobium mukohataei]QFR21713.1 phosphatidylcholine/phosphatidylserine synthase [Halomicrobium sp. ZPS1]